MKMRSENSMLPVMETIEDCRAFRKIHREETLALVPTMGALHEGHLSLARYAKDIAKRVMLSIFVNPMQFGPSEDFHRYPRMMAQDLALCREAGVDAVFLPALAIMYPETNQTQVTPPATLTERLCGLTRPGHFAGVATVVLKLFNIIQPDIAIFGEKDAQQLAVIRKMVKDLNLPVEILAGPTVRESSGLALSSRNRYLQTSAGQTAAQMLSEILEEIRRRFLAQREGQSASDVLSSALTAVLAQEKEYAPFFQLEYLEACHPETLMPMDILTANTRIMIAARIITEDGGDVRLIDTLQL